jgi:17beta-estradiol 17-dehydrogenase / very-long-chain 3-oxoacyl-CoA reductase
LPWTSSSTTTQIHTTNVRPFRETIDSHSLLVDLVLFLASVGSITFLFYSLSLLTLLYRILIPGIPLSTFRKSSPNPWALITGPTSGIGKSYADALANAKFNLILVSRSQSKLDSLAQEIKTKYPDCAIRTVAVDLAREFGGEVRAVCEEVTQEGGDVRVLVNNAGRGHEMPTEFKDVEREEMEGIVGVNVCGVLRVTKDVLPFMLNDKSSPTRRRVVDGRKKKRLIVNVGSFAAYAPTPVNPFKGVVDGGSFLLRILVQKDLSPPGHSRLNTNSPPTTSSSNISVPPSSPSLGAITDA